MVELLNDYEMSKVKNWMKGISATLGLLLMIPTVAILVSWNSVPGDYVHPIKLYLEGVALNIVEGNFAVASDLQTQLVENRFTEAQILLLDEGSIDGLDELTNQAQQAKQQIFIAQAKTSSNVDNLSTQVVADKAQQLANTLQKIDEGLEKQKASLVNPSPRPSINPSPSPSSNQSSSAATNNGSGSVTGVTATATPKSGQASKGTGVKDERKNRERSGEDRDDDKDDDHEKNHEDHEHERITRTQDEIRKHIRELEEISHHEKGVK